MKVRFFALILALAVVAPAFAHHSTSMYAMDKPVTVTGVVKRFEFVKPFMPMPLYVPGVHRRPSSRSLSRCAVTLSAAALRKPSDNPS